MAIHVTIDGLTEDMQPTVAEFVERVAALNPASIRVDTGGVGRVLLAALVTRGLSAQALEKRPRPTLPEVQRIEELSKALAEAKKDIHDMQRELKHLQDYQRDVRVLIQRLE